MQKIKNRAKLRLYAGKIFYTFKKNIYWYLLKNNFAEVLDNNFLPNEVFSHQTILLRQLKDVEMWMQYNKVINLKIAIKKLNGIILRPGQILSYWRQIGKPTKSNGYVDGMILNNGRVSSGVGGGICQLSNLIYWITLHTPLTVVERWRHSYDVFPDSNRNQPFGTGATCAYPNIDLQIKNNTNQIFQLKLEISDTHLIGKWFSERPIDVKYEIFEKDHKIEHLPWGNYMRSNKIFRKIINKQIEIEFFEEFVAENNAFMMYNPFLENKK